ncbi:MAG: HEAT repeat domain-containing protein [Dehalococcoidia bacterium]
MADSLGQLLEMLADGHELATPEYAAFSDLSRADAALVKEHWPAIAVETRALLMERAGELADVNLEYNFEALGSLALDDPHPEVRERAVTALWESEDRDIARRLARLATEDEGAGVRAAAALALRGYVESIVGGRFDDETARAISDALRKAVEDPNVDVRAAAVEAAGGLPEEWVASHILDAYEDDARELRIAAIRAMGDSAEERWAEYIADQLYAGEPELRLEAVLAAGANGSESLVEPLGEALADEDPEIVLAVIEALGEIGGEDAVDLLKEFAPHAPEGFEDALEEALSLANESSMFRRFGELDDSDNEDSDEDDE